MRSRFSPRVAGGDLPPPDPEQLALRYLGLRAHSVVELQRKLERRGCDVDQIAAALGRLTELGYLDDARYADAVVARRAQGRGPSAIRGELAARGVDRAVAATALEGYDADAEHAAAAHALHRALGGRGLPLDADARRRELRRLAGKLARRGFGAVAVRAALAGIEPVFVEN